MTLLKQVSLRITSGLHVTESNQSFFSPVLVEFICWPPSFLKRCSLGFSHSNVPVFLLPLWLHFSFHKGSQFTYPNIKWSSLKPSSLWLYVLPRKIYPLPSFHYHLYANDFQTFISHSSYCSCSEHQTCISNRFLKIVHLEVSNTTQMQNIKITIFQLRRGPFARCVVVSRCHGVVVPYHWLAVESIQQYKPEIKELTCNQRINT